MPYDTEIVLGVRGTREVNAVLASMGLKPVTIDDYGPSEEWYQEARFPSLLDAHTRLLDEFFTAPEYVPRSNLRDEFILATTPLGPRRFKVLRFDLLYDYEYNVPESVVFGVPLSGRYSPTLLDWRAEHGTSEGMIADGQFLRMIDRAREEIAKVVPQATTFRAYFHEQHY